MKRIAAAVFSVGIAIGFASCDRHPSGPQTDGAGTDLNPPAGMVVSDPLGSSIVGSIGAQTSVAFSASPLAYVSALPGTFPDGISVTLRNKTRGGFLQSFQVVDGGFDPVRIEAEVGDELSLTVTLGGGGLTTSMVKVPSHRPPAVVRTNPPKGRTDVALNVLVSVVFTEPVDKSTVTSSSVMLLRNGKPVTGTVQVSEDGLSAEFIPEALLLPEATYEFVVTQAIRDLDGEALAEASTTTFQTGLGELGTITVTSTTTAATDSDVDPDGYWVTVDSNPARSIEINGALTSFGNLVSGMHTVSLSGVAGNCTVEATPSRRVFVVRNTITTVAFNVACSPRLAAQVAGPIAFVSERDGNSEIYLINADGTGLIRLTDNSAADVDPAWSPDGKRIAFTSDRDGGSDIYVMNSDGSNVVRRTTTGVNESPAWSPDGRKIAFSSLRDGQFGLYVMNVDENSSTPTHLGYSTGWTAYPAWSPDGSKIAFVSDWRAYDTLFDLYVVNADGSDIAPLVEGPFFWNEGLRFYFQPAWSPNGQKIAMVECPWARDNCYPTSSIAVSNADGSGLKIITQAGGYSRPTWSPDGSTIAYSTSSCRNCSGSLWYTTADGSKGGLIFSEGHSPAWGPLGR